MASAIHNNNWIRDINYRSGFTTEHLLQFTTLWALVTRTPLTQHHEDKISWTLRKHGEYTTASTYKAQFTDYSPAPELASLWKAWAPPKCKFFAWLILQNCVWTSNRLAHTEWDHCPSCPLCRQTFETAHHLLTECRYTRQIWSEVATWLGLPELRPESWPSSSSPLEWWNTFTIRPNVPRKAAGSIALLVIWEIWKERNNRVFDRAELPIPSLVSKIKGEFALWVRAGASCLASLSMSL
jgi:hypothetical protein